LKILPLASKSEFIEELAELHHAEWSHLNSSFTLKKRIEAIRDAARFRGIPSVFIAMLEDQLVGSAAIVENDMSSKSELSPWLAAVYVKEDFRRQGIAKKLITRCIQEAVQSNVGILYLYTEFAAKYYEKLGWSHLESCEYKGVFVDVMSKQWTTTSHAAVNQPLSEALYDIKDTK